MRLHVDPTACQAYGLCKEEAPDLIDLDDWGYAAAPARPLADNETDDARSAVQSCPVKALRLL